MLGWMIRLEVIMKRSVLLLLTFFLSLIAYGQNNIVVASFRLLDNDLTAITHGTEVKDQNGNTCALIKVETTQTGFAFDVGSMGVQKTEQHTGEIWVYVPFGVRRITIQHQQLGTLRDYYFPMPIEMGKTYIMQLNTGKVQTVVDPIYTQQFLVFEVTPKDAMVTVDGTPWPVIGGIAQKLVDFGKYEYRIEAANYHPSVGKIDVNDPNDKVVVKVNLKSALGWLKIEGDSSLLSQASIYIDNTNGNDALYHARRLGSGQHKVRVLHPLYKPYEQSVTIADNDTTKLNVNMNANFSTVTLQVDADAEIWVNGERKGVRNWTGDLEANNYIIECRMDNHRPSVVQKAITEMMSGQTITLPIPTPINGRLVVSSMPSFAKLFIDGREMGETPMTLNDVLIGKHSLRLEKEGYAPLEKDFVIEEGTPLVLEETLQDTEPVKPPVVEIKPKEKDTVKDEQQLPVPSQRMGFILFNGAFSVAPQSSFGLTMIQVKKLGWYVSLMSNFNFTKADYTCEADGSIINSPFLEYTYTGERTTAHYAVSLGFVGEIVGPLYAYVGAGYGSRTLLWKLDDGNWVAPVDNRYRGVLAEAGLMTHFKGFAFSVGMTSIGFKELEFKFGVGYRIF